MLEGVAFAVAFAVAFVGGVVVAVVSGWIVALFVVEVPAAILFFAVNHHDDGPGLCHHIRLSRRLLALSLQEGLVELVHQVLALSLQVLGPGGVGASDWWWIQPVHDGRPRGGPAGSDGRVAVGPAGAAAGGPAGLAETGRPAGGLAEA